MKILQITILLAILSTLAQAEQVKNSRKLDDLISPPDLENKCGSCPCNNPCNPTQSPPLPLPPPPPSSPPPPPPSPPLLPPPPKNPSPSNYCPPPPSGGSGGGGGQHQPGAPYIYINGPPGNVYSVNPYYNGAAGAGKSFSVGMISFFSGCALWLLAF